MNSGKASMLEHLTAGNSVHYFCLLSDEEPILSLCKLHRSRALLVVVRHVVGATAHWVAPHE